MFNPFFYMVSNEMKFVTTLLVSKTSREKYPQEWERRWDHDLGDHGRSGDQARWEQGLRRFDGNESLTKL